MPPGLMLDEGRTGLCALALLHGEPILPFTHVSEPWSLFPTALSIALFGPTTPALRAPFALLGTLTIPALWWFLRPIAGPAAALLGAAFLAGSRWHVGLSRVALSAVQYPLAMILAAGLFLRAWESNRPRAWAWFGLALAAGFHSYVPGRTLPLLFALVIAALALHDRHAALARVRGMGVAAAAWLAGTAVLGWYLWARPDLLFWRFQELAADAPAVTVADRFRFVWLGLASLNWRGDGDLAHTFPAPAFTPALGWLMASLWIPGLVRLLRNAPVPARVVLGGWVAAGLAGAVMGGVHFHRMGPLAPLAAGCVGVAAARGWNRGWDRRLLLVAGLSAAVELRGYAAGRPWGHDRDALARSFRVGEAALAARLNAEAAGRPVYLGPEFANAPGTDIERFEATMLYLTSRAVHRRPPPSFAALSRDHGEVIFPLTSDVGGDLLHEVFPHGRILAADPLEGVLQHTAVYAAGAEAAGGAKLALGAYARLAPLLVRHDEQFNRRQYAAALATVDAAIAQQPAIGGLPVRRGRLMLYLGRVADAERDARSALARGATGAQAWLLLGYALALQGRSREAAAAFERTLHENPLLEEAWYNRAVTLLQSGQRAEAAEALRSATARFPGSARLAAMAREVLR